MKIRQVKSPNFGQRRGGAKPSIIVLHYTAMTTIDAAIERLCDPIREVSAHYIISRKGEVTQLVEEGKRAWHAGKSNWRGIEDVNSHSIGIELDNSGFEPFSEPLMNALEPLLKEIMSRWNIEFRNVIGHEDCAPGRKFDPGPKFDWQRLAYLAA